MKLKIFIALVCLVTISSYYFYKNSSDVVYQFDLSSEAANFPYGSIDSTKIKYVAEVANKTKPSDLLTSEQLEGFIQKFNSDISPRLNSNEDAMDQFLNLLPKNYRMHFSMIHRSFSIQSATPLSPRVILYGPDAKVMMSFNAGIDETGKKMNGGDSIEIIQWNSKKTTWDFSEIVFDENKKITHEKNPAKCIMCHAGTPKPVDFKNTASYMDKLKPIFPQYPFWPGFYGSVNDIVGLNKPDSKDTIMLKLADTFAQIKGLTFSHTEELFRLRKLLDENPKYMDIVKNELDVHLKNFEPLMKSLPERSRYRNLVTLKELYTQKGEPVPQHLQAAPFRRTFDKEYGHYLLRPNFYLSSLMAYYQSEYISDQIQKIPFFNQIKYSFLARKYNCGPLSVTGLDIKDLDPSFDLIYPNLSSQESRDRQYLLAYQYNVVAAQKGGKPSLPLHAWNLEGNEDIASYHYGNVFSDLNEVVLWNLARSAFPQITPAMGRPAAEDRHYDLPNSSFMKDFLENAGGLISRMSTKQYEFATTSQNYYGSTTQFKALPVSVHCEKILVPAALAEMKNLVSLKNQKSLPADLYPLDQRLYQLEDILPKQTAGLNMVRQACEACHTSQSLSSSHHIQPFINVDWMSESYSQSLHSKMKSWYHTQKEVADQKTWMESALSEKTLPVPFENKMPYGRREMSSFSLACETMIIQKNYAHNRTLKFSEVFNCPKDNPTVDQNSIDCRCKKLILRKDKLYNELYRNQ